MRRMTHPFKNISRLVAIIAAIAFIALAVGGMGMWMDHGGGMGACVFMSDAVSVCPMDVLEHFGAWQSFFQVMVRQVMQFAIMLLVLLIPAIVVFCRDASRRLYLYKCRNNHLRWLAPLVQAFSDGRLQPKIYESLVP